MVPMDGSDLRCGARFLMMGQRDFEAAAEQMFGDLVGPNTPDRQILELIDELPSLVNLLRGEIGLVGPRPLPVHYLPRFSEQQRRRFEVKPGITGLAQVAGRNAVDWPERLALDVEYVDTRSLWLDLRLLLRTIPMVLRRTGVDHAEGVTMKELPPQ